MTIMKIGSRNLGKWMHQNDAVIMDSIEGNLLDNYIVETKRGTAVIYEEYINSNSSGYRIEFEAGEAADLWDNWEVLADNR